MKKKSSSIITPKKYQRALIVYRDQGPGFGKGHPADMLNIVARTEKWLEKNHIRTKTFSQSALSKKKNGDFPVDFVLVLGGDGTYLQAVQCVSRHAIPFLGINMGSFGFLTVHPQSAIISCLKSFLSGKMKTEERALMEVRLFKGKKEEGRFLALNDMVMERGAFSHLIGIAIYIQDKNIYSVKADGLILSTPTGSTAYNLAAGGPILHPQVESYAITPICSHSLTNRPVIVPDTYEMMFKITNKNQHAFLTVDGRKKARISNQHMVRLRKASVRHQTLRSVDHNDFLLLREKLKFFI